MLCRVLLTTVAISYLICVLLLSGVQKEDLDVSMLRKLQRHNVNIDDIDEKFRNGCIVDSNGTNVKDTREIVNENQTTKEPHFTTKESQTKRNFKDTMDMNEFAKFLQYFDGKEINQNKAFTEMYQKKNIDEAINNITVIDDKKTTENVDSNIEIKTDNKELNNNSKTENKDQSALQSLIKFWEMYTNMSKQNKEKVNILTSSSPKPSYDNVPIIQKNEIPFNNFRKYENLNSDEVDYINKMIANYISTKREFVPQATVEKIKRRMDDSVNQQNNLHNNKGLKNNIHTEFNTADVKNDQNAGSFNKSKNYFINNENNYTRVNLTEQYKNQFRENLEPNQLKYNLQVSPFSNYRNPDLLKPQENYNHQNGNIVLLKGQQTTNINDMNYKLYPSTISNMNNSKTTLNEYYNSQKKAPNRQNESELFYNKFDNKEQYPHNIPQIEPLFTKSNPKMNTYDYSLSPIPYKLYNNNKQVKDTDGQIFKGFGESIGDNFHFDKQIYSPKELFAYMYNQIPKERKIVPVFELPYDVKPTNDFFSKLNQIKTNHEDEKEQSIKTIDPNKYYEQQKEINTQVYPQNESEIQSPKNDTLNFKKNNLNNGQLKAIPPEIIKEIAENLKNILLKDLKQEITSTTIATTTRITTTTKRNPEKMPEATKVIEKFMALFEKFKSLNESADVNPDKYKSREQKDAIHKEYKAPLHILHPPEMPAINPYGIRKQPKSPVPIVSPYGTELQINPSLNHNPLLNNINVFTPVNNPPIIQINGHHSAPITLQTNSLEIPPLGVALSKPLKLFNQNIVVTTKHPIVNRNNRQHKYNYFKYDTSEKNYDKNYKERHSYIDMDLLKRLKHFANTPKIERDIDETIKLRNREYFNNNVASRQEAKHYKPQYHAPNHHREYSSMYSIPKIHEELERVDKRQREYFRDRKQENCCNEHVASRQQVPISAKKTSHYDDIHFKNFLKTQEKVNEMLEKILASKIKSSVRDVEVM